MAVNGYSKNLVKKFDNYYDVKRAYESSQDMDIQFIQLMNGPQTYHQDNNI
jgi:hypothetical protein